MRIDELSDRLDGKLLLQRDQKTKHIHYRMICAGRVIALPAVIWVPYGRGEASNNNVGSVARALGLNERGLKEMVGCRAGRPCVLLCLAAKLLEFGYRQRQEQGELFQPGLRAMIASVEIILAEVGHEAGRKWTSSERDTFGRPAQSLSAFTSDENIGTITKRLLFEMSAE